MKLEHSYGIIPVQRSGNQRSGKRWKVLLIQHASAGYWGFPKGHAQAGESPLEAAARELFEETGLTIQAVLSDKPYEQHYMFKQREVLISKAVSYFLAEVVGSPILQLEEVSAFQWVELDCAVEVLTYKTDQSVCLEAAAALSKVIKDHKDKKDTN